MLVFPPGLGCCVRLFELVSGLVSQLVFHLVFHWQSGNKETKVQITCAISATVWGLWWWSGIAESRNLWHDYEITSFCNINVLVESGIEVSYKIFFMLFNF